MKGSIRVAIKVPIAGLAVGVYVSGILVSPTKYDLTGLQYTVMLLCSLFVGAEPTSL